MRNILPYLLRGMCVWFLCLMNFTDLLAQNSISGTVTDEEDGGPLPGVNVLVKGTTTGTITDVSGEYSLTVPSDASVLVFSSVGYVNQEVDINGRSTIDLAMSTDIQSLTEVVVVGYGTQEKRDVTAAIGSVSAQEIKELPVSSSVETLQGRVAGVDIRSNGGRPGQGVSINIRGRRSITAENDPLFVVDGIPIQGTINDINPQDIESMEVLKDAASTAIYGSRGANGVILITTKRGSSGKTTVTYDGYYGPTQAINTVDMMNGAEFADLKRESRRTNPDTGLLSWDGDILPDDQVFLDPVELTSLAQNPVRSTDYQDLILQNGYRTNHQLSVLGGSDKTQFLVSGSFFDEKGIISTQSFTRYTVRVNLDHQINDRIRVGTSTLFSRTIENRGFNPLGEALSNNPLGVPYDENGELIFLPTNDGIRTNPLNELVPGASVDEYKFNRIFASVYANLELAKGLSYRVNFGPDIQTRRIGAFRASLTNIRRGAEPIAYRSNREEFSYTLENILNYSKDFGNNHSLGVTLLQSIQQWQREEDFMDVRGLPYETQQFYNIGTATNILGVGSSLQEWQLASYMGRINYELAGKYLIQANLRADGSSRLAAGNKWAYFPGVSAGWRIIDESFMQNQTFVQELKLRASYGVVGNTAIDPYQTAGRLGRTAYAYGDDPGYGYRLAEIPNEDLSWEKTATVDVGIDYGFVNGRISGSVDFYQANTSDLILERQLPYTSGYNYILQNIGSTRNTGVELSLNTVNFDNPNGFRWTTSINVSRNKEEIVELYSGGQDDVGSRWFIGEPLVVFYDFEKAGIWQLDEVDEAAEYNQVPGDIKLVDRNNDGQYDGEDRIIIGDDIPDFTGGITNRFEYGPLDLSVFIYARVGQMLNSAFHDGNNSLQGRYNNLDVDYWTPDNPTNAYPRPNNNQESIPYGSTLRYFDGSYAKVRNISLGYTLPSDIAERVGLSRARIYGSIQNAFIFTNYNAYDPEIYDDDDPEVDGEVPIPRVFSLGINLSF
uniref:TonB-dependent receptor n=1 Tax=Roseihalotalea indica TaxID=2867963 RepID=A0AA49GMB8_9BACT|nr:TonB-dependent receptor [Tunicatimonas sp. TK19036]